MSTCLTPSNDEDYEYEFDVITALHDDVKMGGDYPTKRVRVVMSRSAYPNYLDAAADAACMAIATNGGMAIAVLPRF